MPTDWGLLGGYDHEFAWGWGACSGLCFFVPANVLVVDDAAAAESCATTTGYHAGPVPLSQIRKGLSFCVRTDGKRFSLVKVTKFTTPTGPLTVHIITLKHEGD